MLRAGHCRFWVERPSRIDLVISTLPRPRNGVEGRPWYSPRTTRPIQPPSLDALRFKNKKSENALTILKNRIDQSPTGQSNPVYRPPHRVPVRRRRCKLVPSRQMERANQMKIRHGRGPRWNHLVIGETRCGGTATIGKMTFRPPPPPAPLLGSRTRRGDIAVKYGTPRM